MIEHGPTRRRLKHQVDKATHLGELPPSAFAKGFGFLLTLLVAAGLSWLAVLGALFLGFQLLNQL